MNFAKKGWKVIVRAISTPRTATGWKQALISMSPLYPALLILVVVRMAIQSTPLSETAPIVTLLIVPEYFLLTYALWMPVFCGLMFRLRCKHHLGNDLLALAIYAPILSMTSFAVFALEYTNFFTSNYSMDTLRLGAIYGVVLGVIACAVIIPLQRMKDKIRLPPSVIEHPFYLPVELTAATAALVCILVLLVF